MTTPQQGASELTREQVETDINDIVAGDSFRNTLLGRADAHDVGPLWHGWALMDAFLAGVKRGRTTAVAPADDWVERAAAIALSLGFSVRYEPLSTPTAREPVKVTEDLLRRARAAEQRIGAQVWRGDGGQHIFVGKLIGELAATISAHHPEVQPAEPMARHWRQAILDYWFPSELGEEKDLDWIEQRARELAAQQGEPKA